MNGYLAFYNGRKVEVYAETLYAAKVKAIAALKVRRSQEHMVSVVLCERPDGSQVTHSASMF